MADTIEQQGFEGWAVLELMGHRKLGGYVKQVEIFGAAMCRIDVPETVKTPAATQFYSSSAIYCVTPTTEEIAKRMAAGYQPEPVSVWQLPPPVATPARSKTRDMFDDDEDDGRDYE